MGDYKDEIFKQKMAFVCFDVGGSPTENKKQEKIEKMPKKSCLGGGGGGRGKVDFPKCSFLEKLQNTIVFRGWKKAVSSTLSVLEKLSF